MKSLTHVAALRALREQPLWRLLAADKAPPVIGMLQRLFLDGDAVLPGSVLLERVTRDVLALRAAGEDLPQTPQAYVAEWLAQRWLVRRLPAGANEETYELSPEALGAIRFVDGLLQPRTVATESRLSLVIQQLARLAEETDTDSRSRVESLMAERERIERSIEEVVRDGARALSDDRALERAREVIALAEGLTDDFRGVRSAFEHLNRGLRQSLMENDGSRGEVLERLFSGVDLISESEAGRTFDAFWRLLTDPQQSALLVGSLEAIGSRPFARQLAPRERRLLMNLTESLLDEGGAVHDVLQHFARSLKSFVQSREFLEQRRLHALLREATQAALAVKDTVRTGQAVGYELGLTSSRIRSVAQWELYDPLLRAADVGMPAGDAPELDLDMIGEWVRQSEIDFRTLKRNLLAVLADRAQASVAQVLARFPAEQGFGSVLGYVSLGVRHGEVTQALETLSWTGTDGQPRRARLPAIYFLKERADELAG